MTTSTPNSPDFTAGDQPSRTTRKTPKPSGSKPKKAKQSAKTKRTPASKKPTSKTDKVVALLRRTDGATLAELMKLTGWQPHSVRGFLSAVVSKKMGLQLASDKQPGSERRYSLPA